MRSPLNTFLFVASLTVYFLNGSFSFTNARASEAEEPSREWLGTEYAEAVVAGYKGRLKVEITNLEGFEANDGFFDVQKKWLPKLLKSALKLKVDEVGQSFQAHLSAPVSDLLIALRDGEPIPLTDPNADRLQRELAEWVLSHGERTLAPHEVLLRSLSLSNGEIFEAWALTWNVFSNDWRAAATRNYGSLTSRLISVTGERHVWKGAVRFVTRPGAKTNPYAADLEDKSFEAMNARAETQLSVSKRGDDFSYFYHRLGVELFAMVASHLTGSSLIGSTMGKIGAYGEYRTFKFTSGLETERSKRLDNDLLAASSGAALYKFATNGARIDLKKSTAAHYLKPNSRRFGKDYVLPKDVPAHYFATGSAQSFWSEPMRIDELKRVFDYAIAVDSTILDPVLLDSNGDLERLQTGLARYAAEGASDSQLNTLLKDYLTLSRKGLLVPISYIDIDLDPVLNARFTQGHRTPDDYQEITRRIDRSVERTLGSNARFTCSSLFR